MIMDNAQLVARCKTGDELAVERLVSHYQPRLFRLALSILDNGSENGAAEAEEATQDAFLAALRKLDSYRGEASLNTWLYAITVNLCRNRLRARRRRERVGRLLQAFRTPKDEDPPLPEEVVLRHEADAGLLQTVRALDVKHRLPVILRYYLDCSIEEIAQILEVPVGTIHSRLNKARQILRADLSEKV
jgi:RNA polymerase sigma-70 factor (ECF subfamily)